MWLYIAVQAVRARQHRPPFTQATRTTQCAAACRCGSSFCIAFGVGRNVALEIKTTKELNAALDCTYDPHLRQKISNRPNLSAGSTGTTVTSTTSSLAAATVVNYRVASFHLALAFVLTFSQLLCRRLGGPLARGDHVRTGVPPGGDQLGPYLTR